MELILLPRLRTKELQSLADETIEICTGIPVIEEPLSVVVKYLADYKASMLKDHASGFDKKVYDQKRDDLIIGLYYAIRSAQYFPFETEVEKNTLKNLADAVFKYGGRVAKLPYNEETAAIDNILSAVKKIDLAPLAATGIASWFPLLEEANNNFKLAASDFVKDTSNANEVSAATKLAPQLIESLDNLYTLLFAYAKVNANEELSKTYQKLTVLVKSYK